jgi:hypothetical protein
VHTRGGTSLDGCRFAVNATVSANAVPEIETDSANANAKPTRGLNVEIIIALLDAYKPRVSARRARLSLAPC